MSDISQDPSSPTILCIENEECIRQFMDRLLRRKFGAQAVFVTNGEDAIKTLESRSHWDLVISDWHIDGQMNGGEVLLWVMESAPHLLNKYVFLSSSDSAEQAAAGADIPFIRKPADMKAICGTLSSILQASS